MNCIVEYFSNPSVALVATQIVGLVILVAGLYRDEDIADLATPKWGFNRHIIIDYVEHCYDQIIGVVTIIIPSILQIENKIPVWVCYSILLFALFLRFSPVRKIYANGRAQKIQDIIASRK